MSSYWTRIILGAYINPLGWPFKSLSRIQRNSVFTIESCERDLIVTLIFSSLFSIKITPLLPLDVDTLLNHSKSCVSWLCGDFLLVVDLLCFRFHCRAFNSVVLYCLIGNRSLTIGIRVIASKTTTTTKFEAEKFNRKSNFLLKKM